jgi:hypothetical protein
MADLPVANPVGKVQLVEGIDAYIQKMSDQWDSVKPAAEPWWKVWKMASVKALQAATKFMLSALDDLILFVDEQIDNGPDKKATVLDAVDKLYDFVVAEALPAWAKPFASQVKHYIVYCVISSAIDFMVDKYRTGAWRDKIGVPKDTTPVTPPPTTI